MHYKNRIECAGRYEDIFIDTQAKVEWSYCKYKEMGVSIQKIHQRGVVEPRSRSLVNKSVL